MDRDIKTLIERRIHELPVHKRTRRNTKRVIDVMSEETETRLLRRRNDDTVREAVERTFLPILVVCLVRVEERRFQHTSKYITSPHAAPCATYWSGGANRQRCLCISRPTTSLQFSCRAFSCARTSAWGTV